MIFIRLISKFQILFTTNKMADADLQLINERVLPKVNEIHTLIKSFHNQEISQFEQIVRNIQNVEDELRQKQEECETYINEIKNKRKDQQKFGQLSKGVLEAKLEETKSKVKNIDAVSSGIKESVSKIKPQKLAKLPVPKDRNLTKLFNYLYQTLYSQQNTPFEWEKFKKLALKHEDGEDFLFRLVNINFKDLPADKNDKLMELKNDPQFQHLSTKSTFSFDIIDLADWVDYVVLGHQFSVDKKRAQKQYDKIRKDADKKAKGSLQMSENFWKEASSQIENYQSQIQSINSELKTIIFGMKKSLQNCNQQEARTNQKINELSR